VPAVLPPYATGKPLRWVRVLSLLETPDSVPGVSVAMAAVANDYQEFFI